MNSIAEIRAFLETIDCGEAVFSVGPGFGGRSLGHNGISMALKDWELKADLTKSIDPILNVIGYHLERKYDMETRKLTLMTDRVFGGINDFIQRYVIEMSTETSVSDQPKRTNVYKEMVEIAYINKQDEAFQNDMLPIINYYHQSKTDSKDKQDMVVHNNNVQALFAILRRKYNARSKRK